MIPVSVIIPVKNEEKNLPECLRRLTGFSQVIIVDSNSEDKTPIIVKESGFEYSNFEWNGQFPKKRNWALRNLEIKNEWVLFLDADEYIDGRFKEELKSAIQDPSIDGYWIYYDNYFMGKRLKYGDRMRKLPLFRVGSGEYEKINEDIWSHLDMEVHEHPQIEGQVGTLKTTIDHNDYKGLDAYISKHEAYATWEAHRYVTLSKDGFKDLTFRQKLKYKLMASSFLGPIYFFISYFLKFGFLDGKTGFKFAVMKKSYFSQIKMKIDELKLSKKYE